MQAPYPCRKWWLELFAGTHHRRSRANDERNLNAKQQVTWLQDFVCAQGSCPLMESEEFLKVVGQWWLGVAIASDLQALALGDLAVAGADPDKVKGVQDRSGGQGLVRVRNQRAKELLQGSIRTHPDCVSAKEDLVP